MIRDSDFSAVINAFFTTQNKPEKVCVAVSGGADSLCLCLLANSWANKNSIKLYALTVDHGLRSESAEEASFVHHLLLSKGIEHTTLVWKGKKPTTRVEEKAREARYRLLLDWCNKNGVEVLLIAHHQDDQAETFLQRLMRSSGLDGLTGMQPETIRDGVKIWRPLLGFSRKEIQETMRDFFHQEWVEDPSNQSLDYERVRLRKFQKKFDEIGLTTYAIAQSAKRLLRARQALEQITFDFWQTHVLRHDAGFVFIDKRDFAALPEEIRLRILAKTFHYVSGCEARMTQLETLNVKLTDNVCTTLCECVIVSNKQGIYVCKELAKMTGPTEVKKGKIIFWNGFMVCCDRDVIIAPLKDNLKVEGIPAVVRKTIPVFFDKKGLAFVPSLDYKREKTDITGTIQKKE